MAIIHLGGADLTGKSTICNNLSKLLDCKVVHFDKPKDMEDGKQQYFNFLKTVNNENIICDRFHDGEHIYAPLYRGYESDYLREFETELKQYPYLFINTYTDLNTIYDRMDKRGEDFVKREDFQKVLDLYEKYLQKQTMPFIRINTKDSNIQQYLINILTAIDIITKLHNYKSTSNYCGNVLADYFIVTDDINYAKDKLIEEGIYNSSWITKKGDSSFIVYQLNLLKTNNNAIKIRMYERNR